MNCIIKIEVSPTTCTRGCAISSNEIRILPPERAVPFLERLDAINPLLQERIEVRDIVRCDVQIRIRIASPHRSDAACSIAKT
jgi:hypothetical protein